MPEARSRPWNLALAGLAPAATGLSLAMFGDHNALGALLLMAEPLLWAGALWLALHLLVSGRFGLTLAWCLGAAAGGLAMRLPARPLVPVALEQDWSRALRDCAVAPVPIMRAVRLLVWTLEPGERTSDLPRLVLDNNPDLVILHGMADNAMAVALQTTMDGEARLFKRGGDGATLVVRGTLQRCGPEQDSWEQELPDAGDPDAGLVLTFPAIRGAGVLPLMMVQMDGPGAPIGWTDRLHDSAATVASLASAVGARRLLVAGDLEAPASFRTLTGRLLGPGLREVGVPPSWPATLGPLPFLPMYALDRVLYGDAWQVKTVRALPSTGHARVPVLVELSPTEGAARGRTRL